MKSPGTQLKEARKERGLSIAEAASLTRIPRALLVNLEEDSVDEFQADVFFHGHIRNYARELGLDGESLVRQYDRKPSQAPSRSVEVAQKRVRRVSTRRTGFIKPTHMFAIVLVLAGLGVFLSLLSSGRATAKDPAQFPDSEDVSWELEQDVQDTRWLLEQPGQ